jgi:Phosphotransferase enzyme family
VLARVAPECILVPLGIDAARGWMLLPDGGPSLGETASGQERRDGLAEALVRYGELQRELEPHVGELLEAGVADMRPPVMPARFEEALDAIEGGEVRDRLAALRPQVAEWSARLAESPLPASLDHNDLHPFNVLSGNRFYDWGDAVVAHPFAVTLVPLEMLDGDTVARDAYLRLFGEPEELVETLDLARRVARIARALVWDRAVRAAVEAGEEVDPSFAYAQLETLAELLED